jgi:hypothetical protein
VIDSTKSASGLPTNIPLTADDLIPDRALTTDDSDELNYSVIAERVADVVTIGEPPLNVALFGPWGSGKSSFYELLRRALANKRRRKKKVGLVRYDAWKYGGHSLKRNFISHAAQELKIQDNDENREFYRGLYEKQRSADVDFSRITDKKIRSAAWLLARVFLAFLVVFSLVSGLLSLATAENFFGQIADDLPRVFGSAAIASLVVGALQLVFEGARVDLEQAAPSADEEFTQTFRRLIKKARKEKGLWRIIFFIDELDRCSADDVVTTLTAIKTFLDEAGCVFIVAADREVLERALRELPQETPVNEETPYYSSASSFLDKVFQHQIALPPLRSGRLTGFARDLVKDRGGVWQELRESNYERLLDRVIYALIPSHVRSPRRIKVLLNNFATNSRIGQGRGVEWPERAREIAKLTVLQTEFPLLAADLHIEPRLPSLLLSPPVDPSDRTKRLLARHGGRWTTSPPESEEE